MFWANLLHIYQPPDQVDDILERIVNESYLPLIKGMKANPKAKMTLNINGCLTELLAKSGYLNVIKGFKSLARSNQIEFTATAKYHPFLPKLPESEIKRQIKLNEQTNKKYFGKYFKPQGFFSPEMAYSKKIAQLAKKLGYQWMVIDEIGFDGGKSKVDFSKTYQLKNIQDFKIFFKNEHVSNLIAGAVVRTLPSLIKEMDQEYSDNNYMITAMDGETFGHHRPGLEDFLFELYATKKFKSIFISEIPKYFPKIAKVNPVPSTWSCEQDDIKNGLPYKLWDQPNNPLHKLQWQYVYWMIKAVEDLNHQKANYKKARQLLDTSLNSCHFWWASKYWWSLEMIEQGAYNLLLAAKATASTKIINKARSYYNKILDLAFLWQREGTIREFHKQQEAWQKTPFKKRAPAEWFNQIILELEDEMKKATKNQEYEKAIKWRDAIIKLKSGADIYDVLHVVNELHSIRKIPSIKPFIEHKKYSRFAAKHFQPHPHLKKLTRKK